MNEQEIKLDLEKQLNYENFVRSIPKMSDEQKNMFLKKIYFLYLGQSQCIKDLAKK